jgi:hypothetical protein
MNAVCTGGRDRGKEVFVSLEPRLGEGIACEECCGIRSSRFVGVCTAW